MIQSFEWDLDLSNQDDNLSGIIHDAHYKLLSLPNVLKTLIMEYMHSTGFKIIYKRKYLCKILNCYEVKVKHLPFCGMHIHLYRCIACGGKNNLRKIHHATAQKKIDGVVYNVFDPNVHYLTCQQHRCQHSFSIDNSKSFVQCCNVIYKKYLCEFHYKFTCGYS